ncbi:hypothetical protein CspeluHIS016_0110630 [Cutaneotrichosporon spelunceum]|uniref:P-loop containing nucleoside triphosphate hydrolase protein n=1 Tax=Cutaneotrichosporon spelunceum TaxID=1672016 RepID=A0AAD3TQ49_9TREE|nr:hypothetical protein CspeluHIS016_0110630 [Cutaneotrichosporon spelunceum]
MSDDNPGHNPPTSTTAAVPAQPDNTTQSAAPLERHATATPPQSEAPSEAIATTSSEATVNEKEQLGVPTGQHGASKRSLAVDPADHVVPAVLRRSSSSSSSDEDEKAQSKKNKLRLFKKKDKDAKKKGKDDGEDDHHKPVSISQLFRFATRFELTLNFIGLFLACAAGATQPLMTLIFGQLTTAFNDFGRVARRIQEQGLTPENAAAMAQAKVTLKKQAGNNALYLMAIGLGLFLCTYTYMLIFNWTCERQNKRIREKYLHAVLRQEVAYFDEIGAGEVATRIMSDCNLVQSGIGEKIPIASSFIATFITGFALAYARQPKLAGAMTSMLPVIMITGAIMGLGTTKYTTGSLKWVSKGGTLAEEIISSIRTVQAFGTMHVLGDKFNGFIAKSRAMGIKGSIIEGIGLSIMFFAIYSSYALAFFYGGILIANGEADGGRVINVFMSILIGSFSLAMLAPELQTIGKAQSAAAKIYATIDRVPVIESDDPNGLKPEKIIGEIGFEDVKFHYPSRPNVPILKGLTTTFEAGKTSALVGASGSGKSTVIQLIERFYDPISGRVTLDGVDIRKLNLKWFRQQIGFVQQEPVLFATTVRGNVEHGLIGSKWENAPEDVRFELVKKACVNANADGFITKLPDGYDTIVGERGMLLSGGQKQRVAIARAIVSDPRILLLDEATSALDGLSERVVQDALDKASVGRTTIVIAHRLATIKDADTIIVMGGGEIIEQGTHNQLLDSENGAYALLVQNQKLSQKAAEDAGEDVTDDEEEDVDEIVSPGSPLSERDGFEPPTRKLSRQITGRSVASAALEQRRRAREDEEKASRKVPFMKLFVRLLKLNRAQWKLYAMGFVGSICSGMVYPAMGILFGKAISHFELVDTKQLRSALNDDALWYFVIAIVAGVFILIQITGFSRSGWELSSLLRTKLFQAVLRHDIEWFDEDENSTGGITSNLSDQPQKIQGLMGVTLGSIVQSLATLVGGCIIGLCYGPLLALIGIACIPLVISSGYIRLRVVVLKEEKNKKWNAASAQLASEAAGAVRTVASLTREDDVDRIYSEALMIPYKISNRTAVWSQLLYAASQGIAFLVIALVFYIGALWMIDGKYDTATFFTTLMATLFAAIQAGNVFMFVPDASSASSASRSVFNLLDNKPDIDADSTDGILLDPKLVQGHLRLENIHFRYPSRPGVRVLRNLTVDVPAGKYVALVGPSGCGKSTSIQMIERFYDPQAGTVRFDGIDIKDLNVSSYRSHIALVSQEPTLYAGTIRFNILLGASKPWSQVSEEEIVTACKDANIYDFIMSLPDGFDTDVGGKGSQLSGGQKQRIAIARALVRNPKVLLLDEATAALDSTSERVVQQALDNASKGRSVVAIAHRLSTIQNADIIYFIDQGKEIEIGTHAQLLARKGRYYDLVMMQSLSKIE